MNKIFIIIKREYTTRVRTKLFLVTTIFAPLGFVMIIVAAVLIGKASSENHAIGVIDNSPQHLFTNNLTSEENLDFVYLTEDYAKAKTTYKDKGLSGILYIGSSYNMDNEQQNIAEYYSDQQLGLSSQEDISTQLTKIIRAIKLSRLHVTLDDIEKLNARVSIKPILLSVEGEKAGNTGIATALGYVMGFVIYIVMLIYGSLVMRGVMEEKTNRIAEVMVSSVKPFQLMMGKIVGIGMVGLTQFGIWIVLLVTFSQVGGALMGNEIQQSATVMQAQPMPGAAANNEAAVFAEAFSDVSSLPWAYLISCFLFFFFGGYLLYASLFAAVGSAAGDEGDQSLTFIVTLPIIVSIMIMINSLQQPNGTLAVVSSMIPFSAPIVMCARLPFNPPVWQIFASMASLIAGFIFTTWLAGKIYRTGILMYGKKVTLKELGKWLTYKN